MSVVKIGVDVGNSDTKTQHCTIVSGYSKYNSKPDLATKILAYEGAYYVPDISERMPYVVDKTQNDQCLILTLFGIAEELLYLAKESAESSQSSTQVELDKFDHIKLGIGLPPGHYKYAEKTVAYYDSKLRNKEVKFTYRNYSFSFFVDKVELFPQDFVAVYKNPQSEIVKTQQYYILGIGGGTVDVIPIVNGIPEVNRCFSLELGTRVMYSQICADVQRQYGFMPDESHIEAVLQGRGDETVLSEDVKDLIRTDASLHFDTIINECIQNKVKVSLYPIVFFGGGALLFKECINGSTKIARSEIIGDVNANAKAYAACLK